MPPSEGMTFCERTSGTTAAFRNGGWEVGAVRAGSIVIEDQQVVGARAAAIDSPAGGTVMDLEARSAIDAILSAMRQHGLIST